MTLPIRHSLPHNVPLWVDPQKEVYFITITCRHRGLTQLTRPEVAGPLLDTVKLRNDRFIWFAYVFLLMPEWQRDFFEHRLRSDESWREKADYILANPVRKGLITEVSQWPYVFFPNPL